jgi:ABC-type Fe3+ transport system substrate-binding protein
MRSILPVLLLPLLVSACTPEPKLEVVVSLRRSAASPVLATFVKETGANLAPRFIDAGEKVGEDFDVLWSSDPAVALAQAAAGRLAPLPAAVLASRPPQFVDPAGLWAAVTADVRVFAYNSKRVDESTVPTHFEQLLDPEVAPLVAIASPQSPSAAWHFAALFAIKGSEPTSVFLHDLQRAGTTFVANERAVMEAVVGDGPPIGVLDGEVAFAGREINRGVGVLIPDQDGTGAILRATTVSLNKRAADSPRALALIEYLLSPPVGRRLALMSSQVALLPSDEPTAGALSLHDMKAARPTQAEIAGQLSAVRQSLQDLR